MIYEEDMAWEEIVNDYYDVWTEYKNENYEGIDDPDCVLEWLEDRDTWSETDERILDNLGYHDLDDLAKAIAERAATYVARKLIADGNAEFELAVRSCKLAEDEEPYDIMDERRKIESIDVRAKTSDIYDEIVRAEAEELAKEYGNVYADEDFAAVYYTDADGYEHARYYELVLVLDGVAHILDRLSLDDGNTIADNILNYCR